MKQKFIMKLLLLLVSLGLFVGLGVYISRHVEQDEQEKFANIDIWDTAGFIVKGNPVSSACGIDAYYDEGGALHYDVYLPWDANQDLELICDDDVTITIGEKTYHNGDSLSVPALEYLSGDISAPGVDSASGQFRFIAASGLPSVFLGGDGDQDTKEFVTAEKGNTSSGFCLVLDENGQQDFLGLCGIRVHGNTSWFDDKKSYQFTLENSSEILGMSSQRKWVLDSEYSGSALLSDAIIYKLSQELGDPYTPDFRFVNVFLDGQYEGLYLLLQKISIEGGTLSDLKDLETINNRLQGSSIEKNVSGGYLVELLGLLGMQEVEESLQLETPNRWMRVRSPNNITPEQHAYLQQLVNEAEEALYLPDGETTASGKIWSDYFDSESWIRQYLLQEISGNVDTEVCSEYFYVKEDERILYGGPAWDYDKALQHFLNNERLNFVQRALYNNAVYDPAKNPSGVLWFKAFDSHADFHEDMKKYYLEVAEPKMQAILDEDVPSWFDLIADSLNADSIKWNYGYSDYMGTVEKYQTGFNERLKNLHDYYQNEEDYALVTFHIPMRLLLVIPVKKGSTLGEGNLPLFNWCDTWYYGDEQFTTDTIVDHDMDLILVDTEEDEESEESSEDGTD